MANYTGVKRSVIAKGECNGSKEECNGELEECNGKDECNGKRGV